MIMSALLFFPIIFIVSTLANIDRCKEEERRRRKKKKNKTVIFQNIEAM